MALVPANYSGLIVSNLGWTGQQFGQLSNGIAVGVTTYLLSHPSNIVTTTDAGMPGAGVGVGTIVGAVPTVLYGVLEANLRANGILGTYATPFALGLATATCTYLQSAQSLTSHSSVGLGTGVGSFVGLEGSGMGAAIMAATGFVDVNYWPRMANAIGTSISMFMTSTVRLAVVISGPAVSGASTGVGSGRIL